MRLSPIIKTFIATVLAFALFGLFFQFALSYLNQNVNGPKLTAVNFAAPFIMTIAIVVFFIQRMFSSQGLRIFNARQMTLKLLSCIPLALLHMWQLRYITLYYGIKQTQDMFGLLTELFPMAAGIVTTFVLILGMAKRNTSAKIGFQKYRR